MSLDTPGFRSIMGGEEKAPSIYFLHLILTASAFFL